jgi:hypothetical protein
MFRTLLASAVLAAAIAGLGIDLARTAYSATLTAQSVTLASVERA